MDDLKDDFPVEQYANQQRRWIGSSMIVIPTIVHVIQDSLHGKTVLDVGCGTGFISASLLKWGAVKVVGIDSNHEMILKCKRKYWSKSFSDQINPFIIFQVMKI